MPQANKLTFALLRARVELPRGVHRRFVRAASPAQRKKAAPRTHSPPPTHVYSERMVAIVSEQPEIVNEPTAVKGAPVDAENADVQNKAAEPVPAPTARTTRHSPSQVWLSRGGTAPPLRPSARTSPRATRAAQEPAPPPSPSR